MITKSIPLILTTCILTTTTLAAPPDLTLQNPDLEQPTSLTAIPGWSLIKSGPVEGSLEIDSTPPLPDKSNHTLKFTATSLGTWGDRLAITNAAPLNIQAGQWYDITFYAKKAPGGPAGGGGGAAGIGLVFSLESPDGKSIAARTTLPEIGRVQGGPAATPGVGPNGWQTYQVSLHAHHSVANARLLFHPVDPGTLWLDHFNIIQRPATGYSAPPESPFGPLLTAATPTTGEVPATGRGRGVNRGRGNNTPVDPAAAERMAKWGSRNVMVHDPSTILKCDDEYWTFPTGRGIPSLHSKDLITWERGPQALSQAPAWASQAVPRNRDGLGFWAPDVIKVNDKYFAFFSISSFGSNVSAIGVASTPTLNPNSPNYKWTEQGEVIRSRLEDDFNCIDPAPVLDDKGQLWLAFGSFWGGIKMIQLDPNTGRRIAPDSPVHALAHYDTIEAAYIHKHGDDYYLFVSWGLCCRGANSTYHTRVGRSKSVTGPYLDKEGKDLLTGGGTLILPQNQENFIGPGHAGIINDGKQDWLSFHFYDNTRNGQATLGIRPLKWTAHGWPETIPPQ